jgi:hypothetical protein
MHPALLGAAVPGRQNMAVAVEGHAIAGDDPAELGIAAQARPDGALDAAW